MHFHGDELMHRRVMQGGGRQMRMVNDSGNSAKPDCRGNYPKNGIENAPSLAMVYSPIQEWREIYEIEEALSRGTLFKELDKPLLAAEKARRI